MKKCFILGQKEPKESPPGYESWAWMNDAKDAVKLLEAYYISYGSLPDLISIEHDLNDKHLFSRSKVNPSSSFIMYSQYGAETGMWFINWLMAFCEKYELDVRMCVHGDYWKGDNDIYEDLFNWKKKRGDKEVVFRNKWQY